MNDDAMRALIALRAAWRFELLQEMGMVIRDEGGPDNDKPVWVFVDHQPCAEATSYDRERWWWSVNSGLWDTPSQGQVPF